MHSPRTLILSIAATACGFLLALVAVIGQASHVSTPVAEVTLPPGIVAAVAQDVRHAEPVPYVVGVEPATSRPHAQTR
jgi:hypothetical protein